ncbi:glycosyltransferase [Synechococcus sp. CBW1004]|uniref:glycosyltransferase family 2 protein n=1 Tax=Synechococcus sp. CBW1004 TaxID=1353136 RepID=UPI0018CCB69B|nr:glycosyltransferase [Synechococcus sp. CBW1004]QPN64308.1 glycosyltransferase [Synechococcus sp. CBW1004]
MAAAPPLVSVLMLTRNHGSYLQQAIASVQAQTLQAWELLIGEDDSSDNTAAIASQAAALDHRIRVFSSPGGALGFHRNFARLLQAAQASYVAFLEGDDWWSEPGKLELQVALLAHDASLSFCGGSTRVVDQRPTPAPHAERIGPPAGCQRISFAQLIDGYSFHFSSVLMRREVIQLPEWIFRQYCLDRPLYLLGACHGDAGVITGELSVYRLHQGGVWAPLTPLQKACRSRALFSAFCVHFPSLYRRHFRLSLSHILWSYLAEAIRQQRRWQILVIVMMGIQAAPALRLLRHPRPTMGSLARALLPLPNGQSWA